MEGRRKGYTLCPSLPVYPLSWKPGRVLEFEMEKWQAMKGPGLLTAGQSYGKVLEFGFMLFCIRVESTYCRFKSVDIWKQSIQ